MSSLTHRHLDLLPERPLVGGARPAARTEGLSSEAPSSDARGTEAPSSDGRGTEAPSSDDSDEGFLLVGDLAKATGKTVRAIHLYEDLGLLRAQERSKGRYRLFTAESVVRVRWISKLQSLGLSLAEIQELVRAQQGSDSALFAAAKLREVYAEKLQETRAKLRELARLEGELVESLTYLSGCDTACMPELPTTCCNQCSLHGDPMAAPELVAGVHAH